MYTMTIGSEPRTHCNRSVVYSLQYDLEELSIEVAGLLLLDNLLNGSVSNLGQSFSLSKLLQLSREGALVDGVDEL